MHPNSLTDVKMSLWTSQWHSAFFCEHPQNHVIYSFIYDSANFANKFILKRSIYMIKTLKMSRNLCKQGKNMKNICLCRVRLWKRPNGPEMECLTDKGVFVFADNEILKAIQIRSYFSRLKSNRQKLNIDDGVDGDVEAFKEEQTIDEAVQRRQLRHTAHNIGQSERATSPKRSTSSSDIPAKRNCMRNKKTSWCFFQ